MLLNFCWICGKKEDLNQHHVIPVVKGGSNDETNLITLCYKHHMWIHGRKYRDSINHSMLIKEGMIKSNKKFGRKPISNEKKEQVIHLRQQGMSMNKIAKQLSVGNSQVLRICHEMVFNG